MGNETEAVNCLINLTGMFLFFFFVSLKLAKSAKEAASKVQEQSEVIGKTDTFKAMSAVSDYRPLSSNIHRAFNKH